MAERTCSIEGCDRHHLARGWCGTHYAQWRRHTKYTAPSMEERFWAKVEKTDSCWLWTGYVKDSGYGVFTSEPGKRSPSHRIAYELVRGPVPNGLVLDHKCRVRRCVNPAHLRPVTNGQNSQGAVRVNQSGVRGVYPALNRGGKPNGRWTAQIKHDGKSRYLGTFDTIEEAAAVAAAKRLELFTHTDGR